MKRLKKILTKDPIDVIDRPPIKDLDDEPVKVPEGELWIKTRSDRYVDHQHPNPDGPASNICTPDWVAVQYPEIFWGTLQQLAENLFEIQKKNFDSNYNLASYKCGKCGNLYMERTALYYYSRGKK